MEWKGADAVAFIGIIATLGWNAINSITLASQNRDLERWKAELANRNSEAQALRDYRFDALKRLYGQVDPLAFQMREPLRTARDQVKNFARAARDGDLRPGDHDWLSTTYYINATRYRLMLPVAYLRLVQERLSDFDVSLDPRMGLIYGLLTEYARAMRADYSLGRDLYGKDVYQPVDEPEAADGHDLQQGLLTGWRDQMADALLTCDGPARRVMRAGEFDVYERATPITFAPFATILRNWDPVRTPVLGALLQVLAGLAELTGRTLARGGRRTVERSDALARALVDEADRLCDDSGFWADFDFGAAREAELHTAAMAHVRAVVRRVATDPFQ